MPLALAALTAKARAVSATEELAVPAPPPAIAVKVDTAALRADIERYIRSVNGEIRATLDEALKPASPVPEVRVADRTPRSRG